MSSFRATHRYRATAGDPCVLVQVVGPGCWPSEVRVLFEDRGPGAWRVGRKSLIPLDECCCEMWDDGDGESGPHLVVSGDDQCPLHGHHSAESHPEG